jgi:rhodanese-related sulfurtransferase
MGILQADVLWSLKNWVQNFTQRHRGPQPVNPSATLERELMQTELFKDFPEDKVKEILSHMEMLRPRAHEVIIREGDEGDYFYLVLDGTVTVKRRRAAEEELQVVAELTAGDSFGEEALISHGKRNATVEMETDGTLLRLQKADFYDHIQASLVGWFSANEAQAHVLAGARWVDVRESKDAVRGHLPNAIFLPLSTLRQEVAQKLDMEALYICYCDNGRLSATAAFLLRQRGYNVGVLQGGLKRQPVSKGPMTVRGQPLKRRR